MIVFIINIGNIGTIEVECNAPVTTDRYSPRSFSFSLQRVQSQTWQLHILRACRSMQACEKQPDAFLMLGMDARLGSFGKEPLQTAMPETLYHEATVTRYVSGVKVFLS